MFLIIMAVSSALSFQKRCGANALITEHSINVHHSNNFMTQSPYFGRKPMNPLYHSHQRHEDMNMKITGITRNSLRLFAHPNNLSNEDEDSNYSNSFNRNEERKWSFNTEKENYLDYVPYMGLAVFSLIFFSFASGSFAAPLTVAANTANMFDPSQFQPVCPASDGFYGVMKSIITSLIGTDNVTQYGPLIAGVLLRIRLELCVFESFLYEAVIPFVRKNGISWVLPLHETVETFVAGTIFAVASNFILLGSTKVFAVLMIYMDALFGFPTRLLGSLIKKVTGEEQVAGKIFSVFGDIIGKVRRGVEIIDTFVGRYLVFATTVYVAFKFLHFKFFNVF